ncbi:hypothetical protein ACFE04_026656 [Oxalis oulophora]
MSSRPEFQAPPEIFYDDTEARKYTSSSRIIDIQAQLSERALELLALPDDGLPRLLLDLGCGSGLSGETISENGHHWIGLDISHSMLSIAVERETEGDLLLGDMGQVLSDRIPCVFGDDRMAFFSSLYRALARGARAVFQIYPESIAQRELILKSAMHAGFAGGLVIDYPHSDMHKGEFSSPMFIPHLTPGKKRKEYLVLTCGPPSVNSAVPQGKDGDSSSDDDSSGDEENTTVSVSDRNRPKKRQKITKKGKGRDWVVKKKEQMRKKGNNVPQDSKYTARKRKARF